MAEIASVQARVSISMPRGSGTGAASILTCLDSESPQLALALAYVEVHVGRHACDAKIASRVSYLIARRPRLIRSLDRFECKHSLDAPECSCPVLQASAHITQSSENRRSDRRQHRACSSTFLDFASHRKEWLHHAAEASAEIHSQILVKAPLFAKTDMLARVTSSRFAWHPKDVVTRADVFEGACG